MAHRTTYRIETSRDGNTWMVFMAWHGLQKCRAEGAFGILMSMYDGVWYRLVEEGGSIVEVSHHDAPSTGQKKERTFTESEVIAIAMAAIRAIKRDMPTDASVGIAAGNIAKAVHDAGIVLDPA